VARSEFGGTYNDWLFAAWGNSGLLKLRDDTSVLRFYSTWTGTGSPSGQYTDLLLNGVAASSITVIGYQIPRFSGPDGVTGRWGWDGTGTDVFWMEARNISGGVGGSFVEDPTDPGFYIPATGGGSGGGSSSAALVVAASDASTHSKTGADYLCDGTGDQVEINNAIAALPTTGGCVVLTEGTFNIASSILIQNDNVTLVGAGTGQRTGGTQTGVGSKLKAASGVTSAVVLVQRAANDRPVYGVLLRDFLVDGNSIGTGVDGITFRSNRGLIDHVHVHYCTGNGFRVQGYASPQWDTYDTEFAFCQAGNNGGAGIYLDTNANDVHITGGSLYNNAYGFRFAGSSAQIANVHTYDNTINNYFFDGGGSRTKVGNCKIEGADQHGVNIDSTNGGYSDIQFTGCNFANNGDSADNTYDHLIQQGPSGNGIGRTCIVGNSFSWKGSGNKPRYGVNLNSSCSQNALVVGNVFGPATHFGTSAVRNNGSSSLPAIIHSNMYAPSNNFTTAGRPAASLFPLGTMIFDTTANIPNWSDGTNWRNASGTIV
jgi:hypothetical protein